MKILSLSLSLFTMLLVYSCGDSSSTGSGTAATSSLKAEETSVSMAVNYIRTVVVTGGNGRSRIHSVSDSSILAASINIPYDVNGKIFQDVQITSKKSGVATVTVQDSTGASQVQILVTVATMATSPVSVKVRVGRNDYVSIMGGRKPYQIMTAPNSAVASIELTTFSSMYVTGVAPGITSVTVRDSAAPFNSITIPIEVLGDPKFVEQGSVAFNSTIGDFSATGVSIPDLNTSLLSGDGAGGWLYHSFYSGELITMMAYRMKDLSKFDLIFITCNKATLTPGSVSIDTLYIKNEIASVGFLFDAVPSQGILLFYRLTEGTVSFSQLSRTFAVGTFSGKGIQYNDQSIVPGSSVAVSNGTFSVPLMEQTLNIVSDNHKDDRIITALRNIHEKEVRRLMDRSVPLSK